MGEVVLSVLLVINMSYEEEQKRLQKLWEEFCSDEDSDDSDRDKNFELCSDDEISSSSSNESVPESKRPKIQRNLQNVPTTSQNSKTIDDTIENVIFQYRLPDDESSSEEDDITIDHNTPLVWKNVDGQNLKNITFSVQISGIKDKFFQMYNKKSLDYYQLFVNDDIIELIVQETNRYAHQKLNIGGHGPKARIHRWVDTNMEEIKTFLAILVWMGLKRLPKLCSYWSKNPLYENKVKCLMSRNRFELLLANLHFSDNEKRNKELRLYKLEPLLEKLVSNFQRVIVPGEELCIDETIVPFRGRLSFRQYIKNKRHKFGVKVYKLCLDGGYTYDLQIYCGNDKTENMSVPDSVVFRLANSLLDVGRTIYTDNFYTSVTLAHSLLNKNTNLVGTLRQNRKLNPKEVTGAKLKKGEIIGMESNTGVVVTKWKDKREVLMLSTKHTTEMVDVHQRGGIVQKPVSVVDYNKSKGFIDISDQMKSYSTALRKSVKWYRKIAIELLLGSAIVNAYVVHQKVTNSKMSITSFKEELVCLLLDFSRPTLSEQQMPRVREGHHLEEVQSSARRRCVTCYAKNSAENGRDFAQTKTTFSRFRCIQCNKFYCITCFCEVHVCNL